MDGEPSTIVGKYLSEGAETSGEHVFAPAAAEAVFGFSRVAIRNAEGALTANLDVRAPFCVEIDYEARADLIGLEVSLRVRNAQGVAVFSSNRSRFLGEGAMAGQHRCMIEIPEEVLMPGDYLLTIGGFRVNGEVYQVHEDCLSFKIEETGSHMARYSGQTSQIGVVLVHYPWTETEITG